MYRVVYRVARIKKSRGKSGVHEFQDRSSGVGQSHVLVQRNSAGWCIEPSSNRPEFLTWYAISAVSWRDAQSLARERGKRTAVGKDVEKERERERERLTGILVRSLQVVTRSSDRKWLQVSRIQAPLRI